MRIEVKRIAEDEENLKIGEIISDFKRMKSWRDPLRPFRAIKQPYGAIAVILPEKCDKYGKIAEPSFSGWWIERRNPPVGCKQALLDQLKIILNSAVDVGSIPSGPPWDGLRRLVVLYAVFEFGKAKARSHE